MTWASSPGLCRRGRFARCGCVTCRVLRRGLGRLVGLRIGHGGPRVLGEEHPALAERGSRRGTGQVLQERGGDRATPRLREEPRRRSVTKQIGYATEVWKRARRCVTRHRPADRHRACRDLERAARDQLDTAAIARFPDAASDTPPSRVARAPWAPASPRRSVVRRASGPVPARRSAITSHSPTVATPAADQVRTVPAAIPRAAARDARGARRCPRPRPASASRPRSARTWRVAALSGGPADDRGRSPAGSESDACESCSADRCRPRNPPPRRRYQHIAVCPPRRTGP